MQPTDSFNRLRRPLVFQVRLPGAYPQPSHGWSTNDCCPSIIIIIMIIISSLAWLVNICVRLRRAMPAPFQPAWVHCPAFNQIKQSINTHQIRIKPVKSTNRSIRSHARTTGYSARAHRRPDHLLRIRRTENSSTVIVDASIGSRGHLF